MPRQIHALDAELTIKGRGCIVVDPTNKDVRVKLHWLLFNVVDDDVKAALAPYESVTEVAQKKWRIGGCTTIDNITRTAILRLMTGTNVDDIPHQQRIAGEMSLVVMPGRAPLCLRCNRSGHI